ncbi:hypothetical protein HgNV_094 [Homarus gammarus nudivirus]|uniref:Uncharacterized protein n=1 Tax=Homarus gammarus nudivirus TaxID=2509616 RepID=A0A411HBD1_9VIRU|nr:hypothetical protein KM727_gp94 [Homarus gammarus nudivirus]QBB28699.1 hypothetical protein HgNV_094 [Homarus gammarus nudivirus]
MATLKPYCVLAMCLLAYVAAESCVVLRDDEVPTHFVPIPVNIIVKPFALYWRLNFTIHGSNNTEPVACVSFETMKGEDLRFVLFSGRCKETEDIIDVGIWELRNAKIKEWSTLQVMVSGNVINLQLGDSEPKTLKHKSIIITKHSRLQITYKQAIDVAIECHNKCPAIKGQSSVSNVRELNERNVKLYFRPGKDFVQLNFEIACTTLLGNEVFFGDVSITREQFLRLEKKKIFSDWYYLILEYDSDQNSINLVVNYEHINTKSSKFKTCDAFIGITMRVVGTGYFSFDCNPINGELRKEIIPTKGPRLVNTFGVIAASITLTSLGVFIIVFLVYLLIYHIGYRINYNHSPRDWKNICCKKREADCETPPQYDMEKIYQQQRM